MKNTLLCALILLSIVSETKAQSLWDNISKRFSNIVGGTNSSETDEAELEEEEADEDEEESPEELDEKSQELVKSLQKDIQTYKSFDKALESSSDFSKNLMFLMKNEDLDLTCIDLSESEGDEEEEDFDENPETLYQNTAANYMITHPSKEVSDLLNPLVGKGTAPFKKGFSELLPAQRLPIMEIFNVSYSYIVDCLDPNPDSDGEALSEFYKEVEALYSKELRIKDFIFITKWLDSQRDKIKFSSQTHFYTFSGENTVEVVENLEAAISLLKTFAPRALERPASVESKMFDSKFRQWIVSSTRTVGSNSRNEIIDLLGHYFGQTQNLHSNTNLANMLGAKAIRAYFMPETSKSTFTARIEEPDEGGGYEGDETYNDTKLHLSCLGAPLEWANPTVGELDLLGLVYDDEPFSMGSSFIISEDSNYYKTLFETGYTKLVLRCGTDIINMNLENFPFQDSNKEVTKDSPANLANNKFIFGDDKKLSSVITIGLVEESNAALLKGLILYLSTKGYKLSQTVDVINLKDDFSNSLKVADLYMPIGHAITISSFTIGTDNGKKLIFLRKLPEGKIMEFIVYVPPENKYESEDVDLTGQEISRILEQRYREGLPNPFIVNISCDSAHTVKGWMYAHHVALEAAQCSRSGIVVMAADRGFGTDNDKEIASHLKFPLAVMDVAAKEGTAKELFDVLKKEGFMPVSNIDDKQSSRSKLKNTILKFNDSQGNEILF